MSFMGTKRQSEQNPLILSDVANHSIAAKRLSEIFTSKSELSAITGLRYEMIAWQTSGSYQGLGPSFRKQLHALCSLFVLEELEDYATA